jgi:hypothetical protein
LKERSRLRRVCRSWGDDSEILAAEAALDQRERPNGPGSLRMKSGASKKVAMCGSKRTRSSRLGLHRNPVP